MARVLYFDCFSGLAGDMTLGALIDLGVPADGLREALRTLPVASPWDLEVGERRHHGLRGVDVQVLVDGKVEGPLGDHDHPHDHGHGLHYSEIVEVIEGGALPAPVVERALAAFRAIGEAEAKVHGTTLERVHFHEVGAVDAIVDVAGAAWGIWKLGVDRAWSAPPPLSRGFVRCAHGRMPLPAPATLEILTGLEVAPCPVQKELVTPTGASFVKAWCEGVGPFPRMVVDAVGWGAGDLELEDRPNLLRLVLGHTDPGDADGVVQIETNLDDLNPELAGHLLDRLLAAGALDAWLAPVQMKKQRPGLQVGALAREGVAAAVEETLLRHSSAIGLRRFPVSRQVLERRVERVVTPFGEVAIKVASRGGEVLNAAPEHDACAAVAEAAGVPLKEIYQHAVAAWLARRST